MKVLVVSRHYIRPGAMTGAVVHRQCVELMRLGLDISVFCPVPRFPSLAAIPGGLKTAPVAKTIDDVPVMYIPYANVPSMISPDLEVASLSRALLRSLRTLGAGEGFDIVHAHMLFPTGAASLNVARQLGAPMLVTTRGSDTHTNPYRNKGITRLTRKAILASDRIVAVSEELARDVLRLARPRLPVKVVNNGVDLQVFRPVADQVLLRKALGLPAAGVGICTAGRLVVDKGIGELMQAFSGLIGTGEDIWLAFVGEGPARPLIEAWTHREELEDRVYVTGALPHGEVSNWMRASDIFVLASYREGLPNVVLEAMACGRPVIATEVGGIPEAVGSEAAIVVPPGQAPPLMNALAALIGSSSLREKMGRAALKRVRERFSWTRSAAALNATYEELVDQGASRIPPSYRRRSS
jgi:glycosyltransferase involved in cell wall biosynthesis